MIVSGKTRISAFSDRLENLTNTMSGEKNKLKTLVFLSHMLNIFGLSCNVRPNDPTHSKFFFLRVIAISVIFGSLTAYALYYKILHVNNLINITISATDTFQSLFDYFQYVIDLIYVYNYGRHVNNDKYAKQYLKVDKIIGKSIYCSEMKGKLARLIGFFIICWFLSSLCDYAAWTLGYGWKIPIVYSLGYIYLLLKILTALDLTTQVMHVQGRLRLISDFVQDIYASTKCLPGIESGIIQAKNWIPLKVTDTESVLRSQAYDHSKIRMLSRCYLMLIDQCTFINQMFGFRILLNSLSLLIDMIRFTNLAVRLLIGNQVTFEYNAVFFPFASTVGRLLTCVLIPICMVFQCESTYRQNDRILSLIQHLLVNKSPDLQLRAAMRELQELVQSHAINFHLANFFRLDYSLLVSTASVVATYTIILVQSVN